VGEHIWRRSSSGAQILTSLRDRGPVTKAELGERLGLGRARLGTELEALKREGLLHLEGPSVSRGGRPSPMVELDHGLRLAGVEVGATSIEVAVTDARLRLLASRQVAAEVRQPPEQIVRTIADLVADVCLEAGAGPPEAVGVGVPGPVSYPEGIPVSPPLMPAWNGFALRDALEQSFGCPAVVDNDVNAMALGERWSGVGKDVGDFFYVKLGTGIGSALVVAGDVYRGMDGCAGDLGHIQVADEPLCACGKHGCLEAIFGGAALARDALALAVSGRSPALARVRASGRPLRAVEVGLAAAEGDLAARALIHAGAERLGGVLAAVVNLLNPAMIVIGGGVAGLGDGLLADVRKTIYAQSLPLATRKLPIVLGTMGDLAGAVGAAFAASERLFTSC
jgi:predicted NBD/HSP70 family sugar kinase